MAADVGAAAGAIVSARLCWDTVITTDHNHVSLERHGGRDLWVHRKGAMRAGGGEVGVLPGSMGSVSFHVEGRGNEAALCSSAHGAGRALSRTAARALVTARDLQRQMAGVWYDYQCTGEAPRRITVRIQGHSRRPSCAEGTGQGDPDTAAGPELQRRLTACMARAAGPRHAHDAEIAPAPPERPFMRIE